MKTRDGAAEEIFRLFFSRFSQTKTNKLNLFHKTNRASLSSVVFEKILYY